jgi:uncharacterized sulfatase
MQRFRGALRDWMLRIRDVGLLPEHEIHARSAGSTPYEMGHDDAQYPLARILDTAELASRLESAATPQLVERLGDSDSAVRYWAVLGLLMRGSPAVAEAQPALRGLLDDPAPCPRVAAAEVLATFGSDADREQSRAVLLRAADAKENGVFVAMLALNALQSLGPPTAPLRESIATLPLKDPNAPARTGEYVGRLIKSLSEGER